MPIPNQAEEFDLDSAYSPNLKRDTDEFLLADDADIVKWEEEQKAVREIALVPYGWDCV